MEKGKYTKSEIQDQPLTWDAVLTKKREKIKSIGEKLGPITEIVFFGAGSSYYLALSVSAVFQRASNIDTKALPSSELLDFFKAHITNKDQGVKLFVGFSRSGETTETVDALNKVKNIDGSNKTLAISCYPEKPLVEKAEMEIITEAAQEESVVMTKSFSSMLLASYQLATVLNGKNTKLTSLPELGKISLKKSSSLITRNLVGENLNHFVFLGSGPNYGVACESMLKMKETALENTEAFHSLEFRHGPKSTVGSNSLVAIYMTENGREHEQTLIAELKDLGATLVTLGSNLSPEIENSANYSINFQTKINQYYQGILFIPFAQQLGYQVALDKGIDPDEPRNLSQVVHL